MMTRINKVREKVNSLLLSMSDEEERRAAYIHLYGVSQISAMIAMKRSENIELAILSGMLHDLYAYIMMDRIDNAHKGAITAGKVLRELNLFTETEIKSIEDAVYNHSDKNRIDTPFDEILKDADIFQHYLCNSFNTFSKFKQMQINKVKKEFSL